MPAEGLARAVRPVLIVLGLIALLMGVVWALQGAWVLPATFMRGDAWIGIGSAVAFAGLVITALGARTRSPAKRSAESPGDE